MSALTAVGTDTKTYAASTSSPRTTTAKDASSTSSTAQPKDVWEPSGLAPDPANASPEVTDAAAQKAKDAGWAGFDMAKFQADLNAKLLEQINTAKKSLKDAGVTFYGGEGTLYDLKDVDTTQYTDEQMGVGQDWGAEATSQRIVDFAMAFRGHAKGMTDDEFMDKITKAVADGFGLAKNDMGDLPGPTGKLFNDTYKATMDKLAKAREDLKAAAAAPSADPVASAVAANTATAAATGSRSSLSILA